MAVRVRRLVRALLARFQPGFPFLPLRLAHSFCSFVYVFARHSAYATPAKVDKCGAAAVTPPTST